jgi:serine/threonine protein kinase/WD40 repeat protein
VSDAQARRDPVEELAEAFLERYRRGERPAVTEYVERHPELAEEIRDLFPALILMERAVPEEVNSTPEGFADLPAPKRLGDYRILRLVGRGGMGVVYEAEQQSLGRHVALKVLPAAAAADSTLLKRFRREAKAAARLHHTNIVPVHDVGESDGIHYYAMQYIQGQGLDEVLKELRRLRHGPGLDLDDKPSNHLSRSLATALHDGHLAGSSPPIAPAAEECPSSSGRNTSSGLTTLSDYPYFLSVARLALQVAEALSYAHGQMVLHRDIKPSNLLLDLYGTVWVTDFGLAKDDGEDLTHTGDVVGTLRYMAPERFKGVSDPRSDVYSLGLTLYELVTLRPAFDELDRGQLLQRLLHQEPPAPRRVERRVPRDLETIILKATAKEPVRRYPTAEALAEDLRRFVSDRPVRARRSSWAEQGLRWCRRNPAWAGLAGAVAGLLIVSLVLYVVNQERTQALENLERAERAEAAAERAKAESQIRAHLAQAAALRRSGQVGQRFLSLAELRKALTLNPSAELRREIRDEATAALVLPDVEIAREWEGFPAGSAGIAFDARLENYARWDKEGSITVCRRGNTGEEVLARLPPGGRGPLHFVGVSPTGRHVLIGHSPRDGVPAAFTIWKLDGPTPQPFEVPQSVSQVAVAFHPDGRHAAVGHWAVGGPVGVYDLDNGKRLRAFKAGTPPFHLAYHPRDGQLAVACADGVRVFDETGRAIQHLRPAGKNALIRSVAWQPPDGRRLVASGSDRMIHMWDVQTGTERLPPWAGHSNDGIALCFNHAGDRLMSYDWSSRTRLWDAASGRLLLSAQAVLGHQFSPEDALLGYQVQGSKVGLWRVAAGRELLVLRRHAGDPHELIRSPVLHPDGRLLAASSGDALRLTFFELDGGEELASLPLPEGKPANLRDFDASTGGWETVGGDGLLVWPLRSDPTRPGRLRLGPPRLRAMLFTTDRFAASGDRQILAAPHRDGAIVLHADRLGLPVKLGPQNDVRVVAVSPDGRWVITCSHNPDPHGSVRVWEAATGRQVHDLGLEGMTYAGFSPDGRLLATTTPHQGCRLWEAGTWRLLRQFPDASFAFSHDGRLLALNDVPNWVRLVEAATGREVARLTGPDPISYMPACFSADGTKLVAEGGEYHALYVWDLRRIRSQLKEMKLDWEWPEFATPPATPATGRVESLTVDPGYLEHAGHYPNVHAARAQFSLALALQPFNPEAHLQRGKALQRLRDYRKAAADFDAFLALSPHDARRADVLLEAAHCRHESKEFAGALADLEPLLRLQPDAISRPELFASLSNNVAWNLLLPKDVAEGVATRARPLAEQAVHSQPGNYIYRNTLGLALYRVSRYREAIGHLERGLQGERQSQGFDEVILVMCWHRLGRADEARRWLDRLNALRPAQASLSKGDAADLSALRAEAIALLGVPDSPAQ